MNKNLVIKNTFILYLKMVITMAIAFLSVRYVLDNLGEVDYGIFGVIGGVVGMLSVLNNAMASGTQRFLSYGIGRGDFEVVNKHFNISISVHIIVSILVVIMALVLKGLIFNILTIPYVRIEVAQSLYNIVVINFVISIMSVPFNAMLNAKENMIVFAYLSIFQSLGIFAISVALYYVNGDKLLWYGSLYALVLLLIFILTILYVKKTYTETNIKFSYMLDLTNLKKHISFSGWNTFGGLASISQNQGVAVILNIFFGPSVNAAFSIAQQVSAQLTNFSSTLMKAITPQIVKSEGAGKRENVHSLAFYGSKYAFFILFLLAAPIFVEMLYLFNLWLKDVPNYAVEFCRLIIVIALVNQVTVSLIASIQAVGKIALYQTVVGSILIAVFPLAYFLLWLGYEPQSVLYGGIFIAISAGIARLIFGIKLVELNMNEWLNKVFYKIVLSILPIFSLLFITIEFIEPSIYRVYMTFILFIIAVPLSFWLLGIEQNEKRFFLERVKNILTRMKK